MSTNDEFEKFMYENFDWMEEQAYGAPIRKCWNFQQKIIDELTRNLEQQKFNNKHNLSIDQQVADKIEKLESQNKIMSDALEFYRDAPCNPKINKIAPHWRSTAIIALEKCK